LPLKTGPFWAFQWYEWKRQRGESRFKPTHAEMFSRLIYLRGRGAEEAFGNQCRFIVF